MTLTPGEDFMTGPGSATRNENPETPALPAAPITPVEEKAARAARGACRIFEKCREFQKADEYEALGLYPFFRVIESAQDTEVMIGGRRMLMLGSNSYMGLTNDPRVKEAAVEAVRRYGSGCAGSRFLNGTLDIHIELEHMLAEFCGKEAAIVFTTGFRPSRRHLALVGREDNVFIDRTDHASIVDGARLGFGRTVKFLHNDISDSNASWNRAGRRAN
jgi:7-keto-8-aminopelargonate synthetase-like enzyme